MENATKALLIAAAVFLAILLISLGLVVYNRAAEQVRNADLSDLQIQQFNEKFIRFEGDNVKGSDVNVMLKTVYNHNIAQDNDETTVEVYHLGNKIEIGPGPTDPVIEASTNQTQPMPKVPTDRRYEVRIKLDEETHLINLIQYFAHGEVIRPE